MSRHLLRATVLLCLVGSATALARPYPGITGLAATADSPQTAGNNPAGIVRFSEPSLDVEIMWFSSQSEWKSSFSESDVVFNSKDSGDTIVPRVAYVHPLTDNLAASFTFLGASFSDDLGNWPGRYFITEYDSLYVNAFPSLAYRINDQWSVAGSAIISYTSFEQERAIANIFDVGLADGTSELEADSVEFGFGLSALYQHTERTRFGLTYQSEIEPERDADISYNNLGPNTELVMEQAGIFDADVTLEAVSPASMTAGIYHEFENAHAVTLDFAWIQFSDFVLSEYYFNGEALAETSVDYDDIYAVAASYTFPVSDRWMLGVGGLATNEMVDDDERTMTLRLDALWSLGVAAEWQWTESRTVSVSLAYMGVGDAPVRTGEIQGLGSLEGEFDSRDTWLFQVGMTWGEPDN